MNNRVMVAAIGFAAMACDEEENHVETQTQYSYSTGSQHSWQTQSPAPIPEPASGLLIAAGFIIVGLVIRKKMQ